MRKLILFLALISSVPAFAQTDYDLIKTVRSNSEVRLLGSFSDLLKKYLEGELNVNISDDEPRGNVDVEVQFDFRGWNWLGIERPADAEVAITKSYLAQPIVLKTSCAAEVNDGGNQTVRYSCVKKLARLIAKQLKWPE
jgi:hypothetical protein